MSGQAVAISEIEGGARWGLIGDPTTAAGADMVSLGRLVRVSRTPNLFRQHVKNEVGQTLKTYGTMADHVIEIEMMRRSAAILAAMVEEYVAVSTTNRKTNTAFAEVSGLTLCLVTDEVKTNGTPLTDLTTEWYPSVVATNIGAIANQIVNGDDQQTFTVTFLAQTVALDQDGQTLAAGYQQAFTGTPVSAISETTPTAWTLPNASTW
jgi:hypothetical protein